MKVAVPVWDQTNKPFENGGHAPHFAIFNVTPSREWNGITFLELRNNPKAKPDHPEKCSDHDEGNCGNESEIDPSSPEAQLDKNHQMARLLSDCDLFLVQWACGKTKNVIKKHGIRVETIQPESTAQEMIFEFLNLSAP